MRLTGLVFLGLAACQGPSMYDAEHFVDEPGGDKLLATIRANNCDKGKRGPDCSLTDISLIRRVRIQHNGTGLKRIVMETSVSDGRVLDPVVPPMCVAVSGAAKLGTYTIEAATSGGSFARTCRVKNDVYSVNY